jgi:L,D-transpeptidase ErfK/SrfK
MRRFKRMTYALPCSLACLLLVVCTLRVAAAPPSVEHSAPAGQVLGELGQYRISENDTLIEIARKFDVGYNAIVAANPGVDPFVPKAGTIITLPTSWVVPVAGPGRHLLINIPEFRLYYFSEGSSDALLTFPLGIGDEGKDTPLGSYTVTAKTVGPAWYVPQSIRATDRRLPAVVPPGPNNPMGSHALRLSRNGILIHGTNRPFGIGRRSSHGCLRLYPEDIRRLYDVVPKGLPVLIVNQPIKVGVRGGRVLVEVHHYEGEKPTLGQALQLLENRKLLVMVDFSRLSRALEEHRGIPVDITWRLGG